MAISVVQHVCSGQTTTNNTTNTVAVSNVPTVGNYLILINRHATNSNSLTAVSDTVNTWTVDSQSAANLIGIASCQVVGDMTGQSITATLSGNDANKGFYVFEVSVAAGATLAFITAINGAVFFNGKFRNCQAQNLLPAVGDLVFAGWADSSQETSLAAATGFTNLPTATGSGYFTTTSIFVEGVYKISPNTTATSVTATGGASPTGYSYIEALYREVVAFPSLVMAPMLAP